MAGTQLQFFCKIKSFAPFLRNRHAFVKFHQKSYISSNLSLLRNAVVKLLATTVPSKPILLTLPFIPVVQAGWFSSSDTTEAPSRDLPTSLVTQADELYDAHKIDELYNLLLQHKDSSDADVIWRLARATCDKGKESDDKELRKTLMYEAFTHIQNALDLDDNNFACHKWYAILLNYIGDYEGTKKKIGNAYIVRDHLLRAIELNNSDATSIHILGMWCFTFADLPWYQQRIAGVLFATPPSSSYDEALKYFLQAERVDPNFYSTNLMMLGKTYLRLGNKKAAYLYLTRARDYPCKTEDDKEATKEATQLLEGLQMK